MMKFRSLLAGLALAILAQTAAFAQCGTTAPGNRVCGNATGGQGLATWITVPATALTPIAGGTVLGNPTAGSAVPVATTAPVLGIPGTSTGQLGLAGATSGTAILAAQPAAGSAIVLLPTIAGTLVSNASAPLAINPTTGLISITGLAGGILAGSPPAFTTSPALGVAGSVTGSLSFSGVTSGTVSVFAQAAAGTGSLTLPNISGTGTFAVNASAPIVLNAVTGNLTCPTCVTSSGGGAITGVSPIAVSAAGAVSIPSLTGTGSTVVLQTSPSLITPALGVATATSLAINGATIGTNALAATGTSLLGGAVTIAMGADNVNFASVTGAGGNGRLIGSIDAGGAAHLRSQNSLNLGLGVNTTDVVTIATGGFTILQPLTYGGVTFNNTVTGTGNLVGSAGATLTGTVTHTGAALFTGTGAAASAAGQTQVLGSLAAAPTLANNGQAVLYNATADGATLIGQGSANDIKLLNKSGAIVLNVPTGTTVPQLPGLASGTCVNGLALDSSNNIVKGACPGAASSVQVGVTTVTSATQNTLLGPGTVSAGTGTLTGVTGSSSITISTTAISANNSMGANKIQVFAGAGSSGTVTVPTGAAWAKITMVGAGGPGAGGGTAAGVNPTAGGNTCVALSGAACTSPVYQAGAGNPGNWTTGSGPSGGTCSGSGTFLFTMAGADGTGSSQNVSTGISLVGPTGGDGPFGFGHGGSTGRGGTAGGNGSGFGSGGQGGGSGATTNDFTGPSGAGGAGCVAFIQNPAASYTYAIGSGNTGGAAGANGFAGGNSAGGLQIWEFGFD